MKFQITSRGTKQHVCSAFPTCKFAVPSAKGFRRVNRLLNDRQGQRTGFVNLNTPEEQFEQGYCFYSSPGEEFMGNQTWTPLQRLLFLFKSSKNNITQKNITQVHNSCGCGCEKYNL